MGLMANYTEKFTLPSRGMLNQGIGKEIVMRNMTTSEEKMLLGSSAEALDNIIKTCIVSPENINLGELISPDKHFLIMKLRTLSYGSEYFVSVKCTECEKVSEYKLDLDSLIINELPDDFKEPYDEFELPVCETTVTLKMPRIKDLDDAETKAKRFHKKYPLVRGDMAYIYRLMTNIMTVDGEEMSKLDLQKFIEEMHTKDSSYLKNRLNKLKIGYDTDMVEECPKCHADVEFVLPINTEFFRTRYDD